MITFSAGAREAPLRRSWISRALLAVALLACLSSIAALTHRASHDEPRRAGSASRGLETPRERIDAALSRASNAPFPIRYEKLNLPMLDAAAVETAIERLRLRHNPGLSLLLHGAALEGLDLPLPGHPGPAAVTLRQLLLDSTVADGYFPGDPIYSVTPWGLRSERQVLTRQEWQQGRSAHAGQLLSELARHGVPLEERVHTQYGDFRIRDLVRDTIANLALSDTELEWNAITLMLYLPPVTSWVDKFGNDVSFSDLAEELMRRTAHPGNQPCYGIHCLEALSLLFAIDATHHVLTPTCAKALYAHLSTHVVRLIDSQCADGSWSPTWHLAGRSMSPAGTLPPEESPIHVRVHVTGHHIHWLLMLPRELLPDSEVFNRSAHFLLHALLSVEDTDLLAVYCPYSHAAYSLRLMAGQERG